MMTNRPAHKKSDVARKRQFSFERMGKEVVCVCEWNNQFLTSACKCIPVPQQKIVWTRRLVYLLTVSSYLHFFMKKLLVFQNLNTNNFFLIFVRIIFVITPLFTSQYSWTSIIFKFLHKVYLLQYGQTLTYLHTYVYM